MPSKQQQPSCHYKLSPDSLLLSQMNYKKGLCYQKKQKTDVMPDAPRETLDMNKHPSSASCSALSIHQSGHLFIWCD